MKAAQALKDSAPSIWMSSGEVMKFCEQYGIDSLCAHPKNKAIHAALRFFFETIDKPIECFYAGTFARDSSSFFASNSGNEHQYLGRNTAIRTMNEKEMLYGGEEEVAAPPIFSPNGRWLIGWANYNKLAIRDLDQFVIDQESRESFVDGTWNHQKGIISDTPVAYLSLPEETEPEETDLQDHTLDYALDNKTIIIQKGAALFCAAISDVVKNGFEGLKKVYTGSENFQVPQRYKVIHLLSDGSVASIGHNSLRVFSSLDGTWSCVRNYPIVLTDDDTVVVNAHRGVAAVTGKTKKGKREIRFYALIGSNAGKKGRIKVENLIPASCAFSPAGLMFVLQQDSQSVPEIFNCARLKKNIKAQTCSVNNFQLALPAIWNTQGIIGYHTDSWGGISSKLMSILNTSRGFSILEGYLLHKETQKENGKAEQQQ